MPAKRTIAAGWAVVALAYAPAVWLVGAAQGQRASLPETLGAMAVFFLPWALSTPTLLRLSAGLPLMPGRTARSLPFLGLAGIIVIPTITAVGLGLEVVFGWALGSRAPSHGLGRIAESGWLTITGNVDDGRLVIEIANAIADANLSSRGLGSGLAGVRERLTAWNDGSGTMTVDRRPDRFVVRIDMPYVDGRLAS